MSSVQPSTPLSEAPPSRQDQDSTPPFRSSFHTEEQPTQDPDLRPTATLSSDLTQGAFSSPNSKRKWPKARSIRTKTVTHQLNVLISGDAGLGKTTFIETFIAYQVKLHFIDKGIFDIPLSKFEEMVASYFQDPCGGDPQREMKHERPPDPVMETENSFEDHTNPERQIGDEKSSVCRDALESSIYPPRTTEIRVSRPVQCTTNDEKNLLQIVFIDTPGFGDNPDLTIEDDIQPIREYVRMQLENHLFQNLDRYESNEEIIDTRVHLCFYFIPPDRFRINDLQFITSLSDLVPIVPIVSKSDCMLPEVRNRFREDIYSVLEEHDVELFDYERLEMSKRPKVFFMVATWRPASSETFTDNPGSISPPSNSPSIPCPDSYFLRDYGWGKCEITNEKHSDFLPIFQLFREVAIDVINLSEIYTAKYSRSSRGLLIQRRLGERQDEEEKDDVGEEDEEKVEELAKGGAEKLKEDRCRDRDREGFVQLLKKSKFLEWKYSKKNGNAKNSFFMWIVVALIVAVITYRIGY